MKSNAESKPMEMAYEEIIPELADKIMEAENLDDFYHHDPWPDSEDYSFSSEDWGATCSDLWWKR